MITKRRPPQTRRPKRRGELEKFTLFLKEKTTPIY
jgi:hypothetical protein